MIDKIKSWLEGDPEGFIFWSTIILIIYTLILIEYVFPEHGFKVTVITFLSFITVMLIAIGFDDDTSN